MGLGLRGLSADQEGPDRIWKKTCEPFGRKLRTRRKGGSNGKCPRESIRVTHCYLQHSNQQVSGGVSRPTIPWYAHTQRLPCR